jgi:hypothetical protein
VLHAFQTEDLPILAQFVGVMINAVDQILWARSHDADDPELISVTEKQLMLILLGVLQ